MAGNESETPGSNVSSSSAPQASEPKVSRRAVDPREVADRWQRSSILNSSICLHFLALGIFALWLPDHAWISLEPRKHKDIDVQLVVPPPLEVTPPPVEPTVLASAPPAAAAPTPPAPAPPPIMVPDLPPISSPPPLAAAPSDIVVDAPVTQVRNEPAVGSSSGAPGSQSSAVENGQPTMVSAGSRLERNLVLPPVRYPHEALVAHLTGKVVIEFHIGPAGEIAEARVRTSSGSSFLDHAALDNLKHGRWLGAPGYYLMKPYEFSLEN